MLVECKDVALLLPHRLFLFTLFDQVQLNSFKTGNERYKCGARSLLLVTLTLTSLHTSLLRCYALYRTSLTDSTHKNSTNTARSIVELEDYDTDQYTLIGKLTTLITDVTIYTSLPY